MRLCNLPCALRMQPLLTYMIDGSTHCAVYEREITKTGGDTA